MKIHCKKSTGTGKTKLQTHSVRTGLLKMSRKILKSPEIKPENKHNPLSGKLSHRYCKIICPNTLNTYDLPMTREYESTEKKAAQKTTSQKTPHRKSNKELFGACGPSEVFECLSRKKPPYNRQIVYLVYPQVYVLPLIGGYKSTAKTIARKRGSQKTLQKMDSLLHLHQKASNKGLFGLSEAFECLSGKKLPYNRQIVYPQVYVLPLIGGYKSTAKTIARSRYCKIICPNTPNTYDLPMTREYESTEKKAAQKTTSQKTPHRKSNKELFGLCGPFEVFECLLRKKPPYNRQIVYLVYPQVYVLPLIGGYKSTAKTIARKRGSQQISQKTDTLPHQKKSNKELFGLCGCLLILESAARYIGIHICGPSEVFECLLRKKPPYNRQIVYLVYPQVYVLPLIGGYKSTSQKTPYRKSNKKLFGFCGLSEVFECLSRKKPPYNRQIVYLVYPQVYVLPLIGGYESTTKTIARKRGSQTILQKMDSLLHLHQKASNKGLSEVFECPSGKKLPYNRQIVYPQVYVLPLIGGYKSTAKTIARKRVTQKALDRKRSNKELFGFYGCRLILELAASYVGIHICGSFEFFECLSGKKSPDHRQIVYLVYPQVYVLPLIGGYKSTTKTIVRKRGSQKTSQKTDTLPHQKKSNKELFGLCGCRLILESAARYVGIHICGPFECLSRKKPPYNRQIVYLVYPQVYVLPLIGGYESTTKTIARKRGSQTILQKMDSLLHLHQKASNKELCGLSEAFECLSGKKLLYNRQIVYPQVYVLPLIGGYKSTSQKTPYRKSNKELFGACRPFEVFECLSRKKPPYNRQIVYLVYPQVYVLPLIGGYESTTKTIARKRGSQTILQKMDSLLHLHQKASNKGLCGLSEAFECLSGKKLLYNRQIVYPQVYVLPLIGGYKSTTKTIARKRGSQQASQKMDSLLHLHRKASKKGFCGFSEAFECPSGKKPPYNRQIVYLVYPQVYDLPLIGGYKSTTKTIVRKKVTQKALDRKRSNKELFGFYGCRLILESAVSHVGIHICGSFAVFECLSGKKPPDHRQIVYLVYLQVYDLPLIGGYKSTAKTIARKRGSQKTSQKMDSLLHLHQKASKKGLYGFSEAFECPSGKKLSYNRQIVYPQVYDLPLIGGYKSTAKTIARKRDSQKASQKMDSLLHLHRKASKKGLYGFSEAFECPSGKKLSYNRQIVYPQVYDLPLIGGYKSTAKTIARKRVTQKALDRKKSNKELFGFCGCQLILELAASYVGIHICGSFAVFECLSEKKPPDHRQIVYLVYPQVYVLPLIGGYKSTAKTIARKRVTQKALDRKKSNKELFGFCGCRLILELAASYVGIHICGSFAVFECLSRKKPPYNRQIVYLVYPQVYDLPLIGGYKSTAKTIARKRGLQKTSQKMDSLLHLHQKASKKGLYGFSEAFECPSGKKLSYNRQIVYPQVYDLPLIGGYKSTTKTIVRKRVTQKALDRKKSNKELFGFCGCRFILESAASHVGIHICGSFAVFECLSGKKPPDHRQIVYLVYPQVYDLPLIGGYKSTAKTIARKRVTQKALDRKKSNKELFGFCECRLILELATSYVGIHICGSFECLSGKKPPDHRQIVYLVYPQVYVLPLIGGYKSMESPIPGKYQPIIFFNF